MRDRASQISPALTFVMVLLGVASCGDGAEQEREPAVRPVKLITLSPASDVQTSRYPAVVSAGQSADLSFQVGGFVAELAVANAQQVNEGDLIARLNQSDYQSQLTSARSQFQNADEEYQRAVRLAEEDAIAKSVLEQRLTQRDVARAQLDTAEKALEDTVLRAPFAGVVVQKPANEGDNLPAGQLVVSLMGHGALKATVDLPASYDPLVPQPLRVSENRASLVHGVLDSRPRGLPIRNSVTSKASSASPLGAYPT